jgi:uncharacterized OB-fold protein
MSTPEAGAAAGLLPVVPFLNNADAANPHLTGSRCGTCKAVFTGARETCSSCGEREKIESITFSNKGELYVFSIVFRSFPGIEVPYVSAIVDLEGGGTVKGNLINVEPDPAKIKMGMPVEVVYKEAPRKDADGNAYLTYYFQPRS